jgi:hypothetical protein
MAGFQHPFIMQIRMEIKKTNLKGRWRRETREREKKRSPLTMAESEMDGLIGWMNRQSDVKTGRQPEMAT